MEPPQTPVTDLAAELSALQARQATLRETLAQHTARDAAASDSVDAVFSKLPEYVDKLRRVQQLMDSLAARTSRMRARCIALSDHR